MAKKILGIDVGESNLKLALVSGKNILKTVSAPMPDNMIKEGRVVSGETMGELIRDTMKQNDIRIKEAAYVMSNETVFVKNVTVPNMSQKQLIYNLPFEFRDYITGETSDYLFDYATVSGGGPEKGRLKFGGKKKKKDAEKTDSEKSNGDNSQAETQGAETSTGEDSNVDTVEILAVGAARSTIEDLRAMLHIAGLKLHRAAPAICSHIGLLRLSKDLIDPERETCILDLGSNAIRMYIYKGDHYNVTREIETGLSLLDSAVADTFNVDVHLAHTYLLSDFEGCQRSEACMNTYINIGVELMRAMNFYRFSNPDSRLNDVLLCGGGSMLEPLRNEIIQSLGMDVHSLSELIPDTGIDELGMYAQAIGITQE